MRRFMKAALVLALALSATPALARITEDLPFDAVRGWSITYYEGSTSCYMSKTALDNPAGELLGVSWDAKQDRATVVFAVENDGVKRADNGTMMGIKLFDAGGDFIEPNEVWHLPSTTINYNSGYAFYTGSFVDGGAFLDDMQKSGLFILHNNSDIFVGGFKLDGIAAAVPRLRQCAESQLRMWGAK